MAIHGHPEAQAGGSRNVFGIILDLSLHRLISMDEADIKTQLSTGPVTFRKTLSAVSKDVPEHCKHVLARQAMLHLVVA